MALLDKDAYFGKQMYAEGMPGQENKEQWIDTITETLLQEGPDSYIPGFRELAEQSSEAKEEAEAIIHEIMDYEENKIDINPITADKTGTSEQYLSEKARERTNIQQEGRKNRMRKFTHGEQVNGELAMRKLSEKAARYYETTDPLTVYEYEDGNTLDDIDFDGEKRDFLIDKIRDAYREARQKTNEDVWVYIDKDNAAGIYECAASDSKSSPENIWRADLKWVVKFHYSEEQNLKSLTHNFDSEIKFYSDEIEKARKYYEVEGDTLEEIADNWNAEHAGDTDGELKVNDLYDIEKEWYALDVDEIIDKFVQENNEPIKRYAYDEAGVLHEGFTFEELQEKFEDIQLEIENQIENEKDYRVELHYWVDGSGYSCNVTFENFKGFMEAEKYVEECKGNDINFLDNSDYDAVNVEIYNEDDELVSEFWVTDEYYRESVIYTPENSILYTAEKNDMNYLILEEQDSFDILAFDWDLSDEEIADVVKKYENEGLAEADFESNNWLDNSELENYGSVTRIAGVEREEYLASQIDELMRNYDPYDYDDQVDNREDNVRMIAEDIRTGNTSKLMRGLNDIIENEDTDIEDFYVAKKIVDRLSEMGVNHLEIEKPEKNILLPEEVNKKIENHQHYLYQDCDGWEEMCADFSNTDLTGFNFAYKDLSHANFSGADLSEANCSQTDFTGADFSGAKASNANFYNACMAEANCSHVDFTGSNLSAVLTKTDFTNANLTDTKLSGALMENTILYGVTGANYSGAISVPENYLKNAEMAIEDDYNSIDGIINNGKKEWLEDDKEKGNSKEQPKRTLMSRKMLNETAKNISKTEQSKAKDLAKEEKNRQPER